MEKKGDACQIYYIKGSVEQAAKKLTALQKKAGQLYYQHSSVMSGEANAICGIITQLKEWHDALDAKRAPLMKKISCTECGASFARDHRYCPACGITNREWDGVSPAVRDAETAHLAYLNEMDRLLLEEIAAQEGRLGAWCVISAVSENQDLVQVLREIFQQERHLEALRQNLSLLLGYRECGKCGGHGPLSGAFCPDCGSRIAAVSEIQRADLRNL